MAVVPLNWATPARVLCPTVDDHPPDNHTERFFTRFLIPCCCSRHCFRISRPSSRKKEGKKESPAKQGGGYRRGTAASVRRAIPSSPRERERERTWSKKDDATRRGTARRRSNLQMVISREQESPAARGSTGAKQSSGEEQSDRSGRSKTERASEGGNSQAAGSRKGDADGRVKDRGEREKGRERERERERERWPR